MPTSLYPQSGENRLALRIALRLPIVVSGRDSDGAAWSEPTETDDISTNGALLHLNQQVSDGENLFLRSSHRPDGILVEVRAKVVRAALAIYGSARGGVAITELTENWLRLFMAWIADDQPENENGGS